MKYFFFLILTFASLPKTKAQSPGEIVGTSGSGLFHAFTSTDLSTQGSTTLSSLGNRFASQGSSTYDKVHDIYFFKLGTVAIYKVDAQTGTVLDSIGSMVPFSGIEYEEDCDCIYGIYNNNLTGTLSLASIDFISKTINLLNTVSFGPIIVGESGYDQVNSRYFRAGMSTIEMLDNQGNLLDVLPRPGGLKNFEYDEMHDRLIGIYFDPSNNMIITSVDIASHQVTDLDTIPFTSSLLSGESTFDQVNQRYIFRTFNDLYIYDLQNLATTMISDPFPGQMTGIEYKGPPVLPPPVETTAISKNMLQEGLMVYPNPAESDVYFEGLKPGSRLRVFNIFGNCIYDETSEKNEVYLSLKDVTTGLYFYEVIYKDEVKRGKLVLK